MHGFVVGQFRMKGAGEDVALLNQDGKIPAAAKDANSFPNAANHRCANKNHFHRVVGNLRAVPFSIELSICLP